MSPHFLWIRLLRNCYLPATIFYAFVGQTVRVSVFSSLTEAIIPSSRGSWLAPWSHTEYTPWAHREEGGLATHSHFNPQINGFTHQRVGCFLSGVVKAEAPVGCLSVDWTASHPRKLLHLGALAHPSPSCDGFPTLAKHSEVSKTQENNRPHLSLINKTRRGQDRVHQLHFADVQIEAQEGKGLPRGHPVGILPTPSS